MLYTCALHRKANERIPLWMNTITLLCYYYYYTNILRMGIIAIQCGQHARTRNSWISRAYIVLINQFSLIRVQIASRNMRAFETFFNKYFSLSAAEQYFITSSLQGSVQIKSKYIPTLDLYDLRHIIIADTRANKSLNASAAATIPIHYNIL